MRLRRDGLQYLYRKPNRHIFELALEKAGLRPEDVWYVGDQYLCDIVGARNANIFPVWYKGAMDLKQEEAEDTLSVESWKQLRELIANEAKAGAAYRK